VVNAKQLCWTAGIVLFLDVITKQLVVWYEPVIEVLPFFSLVTIYNTGALFGAFQGMRVALILASLLALWLVWKYADKLKGTVQSVAAGLIVGGAVGNLLDRVFRGAVVDFLDFYVGTWHWPAFNIADAALVVGVLILIFRD